LKRSASDAASSDSEDEATTALITNAKDNEEVAGESILKKNDGGRKGTARVGGTKVKAKANDTSVATAESIPNTEAGNTLKPKKRRRTPENDVVEIYDDVETLGPGAFLFRTKWKGSLWNDELENALKVAAAEHDKDWTAITNKLNTTYGTSFKNSQVQKRFQHYVCEDAKAKIVGPWTKEEVELLQEIVPKNTRENPKKVTYNWDVISQLMNRRYFDCQNKWNTISKSTMKVGRFTAEEDDIIRTTVSEWPAPKQGMWVHLQTLLNRRNDVIRKRWQTVLCKRPPPITVLSSSSSIINNSSNSVIGVPTIVASSTAAIPLHDVLN